MKKELKEKIYHAYDMPPSQQKQEFLQNLNYPKTRGQDFLVSQLGYISKKVWIVSVMMFLAVCCSQSIFRKGDLSALWVVSSMIPFLTLMTVTEVTRSAVYGMAELEMSARYGLRSVLFARMGILGVGNFVLLLIIMPFLSGKLGMGIFKIGTFLLVPYLLTCFISFTLVNRFRTGETSYYCAGAAVLVSAAEMILNTIHSSIYQDQYFSLWLAVLVLLLTSVYREIYKYIKNTEELTWNLYLTV